MHLSVASLLGVIGAVIIEAALVLYQYEIQYEREVWDEDARRTKKRHEKECSNLKQHIAILQHLVENGCTDKSCCCGGHCRVPSNTPDVGSEHDFQPVDKSRWARIESIDDRASECDVHATELSTDRSGLEQHSGADTGADQRDDCTSRLREHGSDPDTIESTSSTSSITSTECTTSA